MSAVLVPAVRRVRDYPAGEVCEDCRAGDVVLVRHPGFVARGIRTAERIRRPRGENRALWRRFCGWNHVAIGVGYNLVSQEAGAGDVVTDLRDMVALDYAVVELEMPDDQRSNVAAFGEAIVGSGYGFVTIVADLFNAVTGVELTLGWANRMVCSTAVCRALERTGMIPDRSPYAVTPAHLAWYLGVPYLG